MGSLTGSLAADSKVLESLPVDVSMDGIGLLLDPAPRTGAIVEWDVPSVGKIQLKVVWSIASETNSAFAELQNMRRCGLTVLDKSIDLVKICGDQIGMEVMK